ncbi:aminoglycoside phosphotransferase family protein [Spirillospora albida]|uniref:phosphotransferase n=1 Tax=Spirillospora albida TaxID=58123 RepID=UPI0006904B2C|nr:aminoglycoside phosphotransferase family protein [Spirillospora albida]
MPAPHLPSEIRAALDEVRARYGAPVDDAHLIRQHSNAAVALPSAGLLVRIAGRGKLDRIAVSMAVTRWLADRGYPAVEPAADEPLVVGEQVVSVWRLLDVQADEPGSAADLGRLLRELHDLPAPPVGLPDLRDPLGSVAAAVQDHPGGMTDQDRVWLMARIDALRESWTDLQPTLPVGLVHGDAHSNNLMRLAAGGVVLGDWDHVSRGPREWDLVQPYYMARRFGRHDRRELDEFAEVYGWDVRGWAGFEFLVQVREVTGLSPYVRKASHDEWSRDEVAHRIATIRDHDSAAAWNSPRKP